MKLKLKVIAVGILIGGMVLGSPNMTFAVEQVVLQADWGNPNELFDTLSISKVLKKEKLNEDVDLYKVEKGSTLTVLNEQIPYISLEVVNIVDGEIVGIETADDFWKEALEEKITITGWEISEQEEMIEMGIFSTFEEAEDASSEFEYYTKGSTIAFNMEGIYSVNYAMGPQDKGIFLISVGETSEQPREEPKEEAKEESKEESKVESKEEVVEHPKQENIQTVAKYNTSKVMVNNKEVAVDAYTISDNNYIKLRDFAKMVNGTEKQFDVKWIQEKNAIDLITNTPYTAGGTGIEQGDGKDKAAVLNNSPIYKDGVSIQLLAYTINDNNYFKLRDLAKAFDIGLTWDAQTSTVGIDTELIYE